MNKTEKHGAIVRERIVDAGLDLWRNDPTSFSLRSIAEKLNLTHGAILYHFKSSENLKNCIAEKAVTIGDIVVVPYLITARHPAVSMLSSDDRAAYLAGCPQL